MNLTATHVSQADRFTLGSARLTDKLSLERERELIAAAQSGDKDALDELVCANISFFFWVINRILSELGMRVSAEMHEDLLQQAALAFVRTVQLFDLKRDNRIHAYAYENVYRAVRRYLLRNQGSIRVPEHALSRMVRARAGQAVEGDPAVIRAAENAMRVLSLDDQTQFDNGLHELLSAEFDLEDIVEAREKEERVRRALDKLTEVQKYVFCELFVNGASPDKLAAELRISRQRLYQISTQARCILLAAIQCEDAPQAEYDEVRAFLENDPRRLSLKPEQITHLMLKTIGKLPNFNSIVRAKRVIRRQRKAQEKSA